MSENRLDEQAIGEPAPPQRRDRLTVALFVAVTVALIAVLGLTGFMLYYGLTPKAPRTAVEMQIETLEGVTKSNPHNVQSWAMLADAYINAGKYDEASQTFGDAKTALGGEKGDVVVEQGKLLFVQGKLDEAITVLKHATQIGEAERKAKQDAYAKKDVTQVVVSQTVNDAQVMLGDIYTKQKRFADAVTAYTRALKEDPNMADVLVSRGNAYAAEKRVKEAEADFKQALAFIPGYDPARAGLEKLKAVGK